MDNRNLELYYFPSCPYCQKVLKFLEQNNIKVNLKNIHEDKAADKKLVEVGGKRQVPCLFIEGEPMYESDDIIEWFKNYYRD